MNNLRLTQFLYRTTHFYENFHRLNIHVFKYSNICRFLKREKKYQVILRSREDFAANKICISKCIKNSKQHTG